MKNFWLFLLAAAVPLGLTPAQGPPGGRPGGPPPAQPVVVAPVQMVSESPTFKGNGLLAPLQKAVVAAEVAGRVAGIQKRVGDFVVKGDLMAELTNTDLELDLAVLRARMEEVVAERNFSRQKQTRAQRLFEQKLAPQEQFENETASAEVAEARVASIQAQMVRLQTQIALMKVRAPFAGQIVTADLEIGQWVTPNKPIFEVYDYRRLELLVGAPARFLNQISTDIPVTITIPEVGRALKGRVEAVARHVQAGSGNFQLRISLDNPERIALSGLLAQVEIPVGSPGQAMAVPRDAIVRKGGATMLVVVREGKAVTVPVQVQGNLGDGSVIIAGPVQPSEEVVVRGNERLRTGAPVRITGKK